MGFHEMETFGHLFDSFYLTFPEFNLGDHQNVSRKKWASSRLSGNQAVINLNFFKECI